MIDPWVLAVVILFVILLGVIIVMQMRILTTLEIVVRAIPLGTPRVQERRPAAVPSDDNRTRPVASSAPRH